jgi:hypothetical protein
LVALVSASAQQMVDLTDLQDISQLSQYWACRNAAGISLQDAVHGQVQLGPTAKLLCDSAPGGAANVSYNWLYISG